MFSLDKHTAFKHESRPAGYRIIYYGCIIEQDVYAGTVITPNTASDNT